MTISANLICDSEKRVWGMINCDAEREDLIEGHVSKITASLTKQLGNIGLRTLSVELPFETWSEACAELHTNVLTTVFVTE